MAHQKHDTQEETESQVSFEAMLREKIQQALGIGLCFLVCVKGRQKYKVDPYKLV
jgi:hypothetical protein